MSLYTSVQDCGIAVNEAIHGQRRVCCHLYPGHRPLTPNGEYVYTDKGLEGTYQGKSNDRIGRNFPQYEGSSEDPTFHHFSWSDVRHLPHAATASPRGLQLHSYKTHVLEGLNPTHSSELKQLLRSNDALLSLLLRSSQLPKSTVSIEPTSGSRSTKPFEQYYHQHHPESVSSRGSGPTSGLAPNAVFHANCLSTQQSCVSSSRCGMLKPPSKLASYFQQHYTCALEIAHPDHQDRLLPLPLLKHHFEPSMSSPRPGSYQLADSSEATSLIRQPSTATRKIIEVWADNLEEAFRSIRDIVEQYHYVAIDTEFPGVVAMAPRFEADFKYRTIKCNVDILNVIQLGITFANEEGLFPQQGSTWQFNFKFDLEHELYAENAIQLLRSHGIDFHTHQSKGIDIHAFGELIMFSGLVMCKNIKWISFHGCYDFGYLLKLLTCAPLPNTEKQFFELLHDYFPSFCDIKYLLKECPTIGHNVSLEKIATHLKVDRIGHKHQAGSDSLVTCLIFFKLREMHFRTKESKVRLFSDILYGLRNDHRT